MQCNRLNLCVSIYAYTRYLYYYIRHSTTNGNRSKQIKETILEIYSNDFVNYITKE